jgi:hypothetical protein
MTHTKLMQDLIKAGFNSGWVVRNGVIVLWENEEPVPADLQEFVNLEVIEEVEAE